MLENKLFSTILLVVCVAGIQILVIIFVGCTGLVVWEALIPAAPSAQHVQVSKADGSAGTTYAAFSPLLGIRSVSNHAVCGTQSWTAVPHLSRQQWLSSTRIINRHKCLSAAGDYRNISTSCSPHCSGFVNMTSPLQCPPLCFVHPAVCLRHHAVCCTAFQWRVWQQ